MTISNSADSSNPVASSSNYDLEHGRILGVPGPAPTCGNLDEVWAFVQPALSHILSAQTPNGEPARRSLTDEAYQALVGLAALRLSSNSRSKSAGKQRDLGPPDSDAVSYQIDYGPYLRLEDTFRRHTQNVLDNVPANDSLIDYLLVEYERYNRSAAYISRLLSYLHRHFVRHMIAAGHGWLDIVPRETMNKLLRSPPIRRPTERELEEQIVNEIKTRRLAELKKWGYTPGARSRGTEAIAEACAEAASPPNKIVPIVPLALRQWRIQVPEHLGAESRLLNTCSSTSQR